ncbi:pectin lyase 2 [Dactylonectria estremocensis]|uniref:pectin lyase n=1 Tax=Dactylonectria estremocensis TaxID=1079267 RepID=A0A9P9DGL0_9HYPO|nr:pectin lyase 2 [Dactylonectria estremocensis]
MKTSLVLASIFAAIVRTASADGVEGTAEGFASEVTGGGSATPVYPTTNDELVSYLADDEARVIVLQQEFDFTGTDGTLTEEGCAPWGTGDACQLAINQNGWCDNYQSSATKVSVTYDAAATIGISVGSNKSIVGKGSSGGLRGKGLRIVGAQNVIVQNIYVTELNPSLVWGGDGITIDDSDLVWIDHVSTSLIGRQHIVLGTDADNRVTISNNNIDGTTSWSPNCDSYAYWGVYLGGSSDQVTFKNNYLHHTSGRSPKVTGSTLLHAVNNYFSDINGHAFEIDSGTQVLAEGNLFEGVNSLVEGQEGQVLVPDSDGSACSSALGRNCEANGYTSSGTWSGSDSSFLSSFSGYTVASAEAYSSVSGLASSAGNTI